MQLRYNKTIRKNIVTVDLEAVNFTKRELEAFQRFGEPTISVEKLYPIEDDNPTFPVKFSKRLRSSFRIRVKFDGTHDIEGALVAAESFYEDVVVMIEDALYEVTDKLEDSLTYDLGCGIEIIKSGDENFIDPSHRPGCDHVPHMPPRPEHHVHPPKPGKQPPHCNDSMVVWIDDDSIHS
jgi:hypothetical protein